MTDIASLAHVQQALSPLHVRAYFDEELFAREQETIFKQSAIYVGHEKGVPEPGDWRRLPHEAYSSNPPSASATKGVPEPATGAACHTRGRAAACWCATLAASS